MTLEWTMSVWRFLLGLAVSLFCSASPAWAILIEMKEVKNPVQVGGFLLRDDGTKLTISIRTPDGKEQLKEYLHAKITIVHQLDVKVLESLSKDNPKAYRDYAEKLAGQKKDPEAVDTALRLYLIAAKLAPDRFGSSSLLAMSDLASTPAEARKYRALAFLLDPKAGAELLKAEVVKPAPLDKTQLRALEDFIKALQNYRAGRIEAAISTAKKDGVDKIFSMARLDQKTFLQWCADAHCKNCSLAGRAYCSRCKGSGVVLSMFGQKELCPTCKGKKTVTCPECGGTHVLEPLPEQTVHVVLRSELWAMHRQGVGEDAGPKEAPGPKGWSTVLKSGRLTPVRRLSLESVSEFDLSKTRYRNGKWVEE
jgi:hypothetical protein